MTTRPLAAVVGVGTELVTGLRIDTNTAEIAASLLGAGYRVVETVRVADDVELISGTLRRLTGFCSLVIVTGGLGPTHDDVTREAAAHALGLTMQRNPDLVQRLAGTAVFHRDSEAKTQLRRQADVLESATPIIPSMGTAPGQIVPTPAGTLVILPGPPHEMRPMLADFLTAASVSTPPARLRCAGVSESDVQVRVQRVLESFQGIELTVLASPADVEVVLFDDEAGASLLASASAAVRDELGDSCYSSDGSTLAQVVVRSARDRGRRIALAESCTGGMIASALTDVPGSSDVFAGGIVSYSNEIKTAVLGVAVDTLATHGAVSEATAAQMARRAAVLLDADLALGVTGIAGPTGGTTDKPVGTVCFGLADSGECRTWRRQFFGDRAGVRLRATVAALDALRREILKD